MSSRVRRATAGVLIGALATGALVVSTGAGTAQAAPKKTLRSVAWKQDHRFVGVAVADDKLSDEQYAGTVRKEFSSVTPENVMKWETIEPAPGEFNFEPGDRLVDFARKNHQLVYGHVLVWHSQLPAWVQDGDFTAEELSDITENHITEVVSHYKGKVQRWDVLNEVFNEDGTFRETKFYQTLGEDYIADAFRAAHAADPKAKLFINDYNTDGIGPKSDAMYELVKDLLADGVPIHGVGIQSHMILDLYDAESYEANIQRFADLGLEVVITELDIRMEMPATEEKLAAQAEQFRAVTQACVNVDGCTGITVWGLRDNDSWVPGWFEGQGAPLLFNEDYSKKPAYHAMYDAFKTKKKPCWWGWHPGKGWGNYGRAA
ncbi:endo-1,4-beta-xylanase [Streptomyces sp. YIM 98790]|uniref:endo-1,4-beta-xylanase n=1 Tax=Streptomyces sp. YIM 98790 TaxID=2689077 RepID=UPI0014099607|nr:endo-1,4-beta-xylanase [Streptomyces sp. YIM 98790]